MLESADIRVVTLCLLPLMACTGQSKLDSDLPDSEELRDSQGETSDTGLLLVPPCGDGGWGFIDDPEGAIHVRADGDPAGEGTASDPIRDLERALELSRERAEDKHIAIGPGEFELTAELALDLGGGRTDSGTRIQGCGVDETVLSAEDINEPVITVNGATGVVLEGLCSRGGTRDIVAWSGAEVQLSSVRIEDAEEAGLVVHGHGTTAVLTDVEVHDTIADSTGSLGYGFSFQGGSTVAMSGGGAWGSVGAGILIDAAEDVQLSSVVVEVRRANDDGLFGRGIQIQQEAWSVVIEDSLVVDNVDAGIFALNTLDLVIWDSDVSTVAASVLPDSAQTSGDGVVVTRGDEGYDPSGFLVVLTGNSVDGAARAALVVDGVTATVDGNTDLGSPQGMVAQGPAVVSGSDALVELAEDEALPLNLQTMSTVEGF